MRKYWPVLILAVVLVAALWWYQAGDAALTPGTQDETALPPGHPPVASLPPEPGNPAPDFTLTTLEGQEVTLSRQRGKIVLLNFWSTECPFCVQEMPELQRFYEAHRDRVEVWTINSNPGDSPEEIRSFLEENDLTLPVLLDHEGVAAIAYQVAFIPATYLIDEEGVIRFNKVGAVAPGEMDGWLEELASK